MKNRIAELRERKGLSQRRLGELVNSTGVQIGYLERGERRLTIEWMRRIADALGCESADLLPGSQGMPSPDAPSRRTALSSEKPIDRELLNAVVTLVIEIADRDADPADIARLVDLLYDEFAANDERVNEKDMRMAVKIAVRSAGIKGRAT